MADETTLATQDGERRGQLALVVLRGDHVTSVPLGTGALVLGRGPPSDVVVEEPTLSREHLRISPRTDGLQGVEVVDLSSKNGLRLRGERVARAVLDVGESIEAGGITLLIAQTSGRRERRPREVPLGVLLRAIDDELVRQEMSGRSFTLAVLCRDDVREGRGVDRWARLEGKGLEGKGLEGTLACWLMPELDLEPARAALHGARAGLVASRGAESAGALVALARRAYQTGSLEPVVVDEGVVAISASMRATLALASRLASAEQPVLITGETGSGKELVARHLHTRGVRKEGPFFALNCAAIPATLLESTLFGHEKGAFTGATERRRGAFEEAHRGTLFLDELGELSAGAQAALLRVLETGRLLRVGGTQEVEVDVRLVSATHRDLRRAVQEGRFREDLFHRVSVLPIDVPPLRERPDDLVALAQVFAARAAERAGRSAPLLSPDAVQALLAHDWPGNVRELRNVMERAVLLGEGDRLSLSDVAQHVPTSSAVAHTSERGGAAWNLRARLVEFESELIVGALDATGGSVELAAQLLGLPRRTLAHKIAKLGIRRRWDRQ